MTPQTGLSIEGNFSVPGKINEEQLIRGTAVFTVEKFVKQYINTFVTGKISQSRRQHGDLILDGWYLVVPNTGTMSWTITGDID